MLILTVHMKIHFILAQKMWDSQYLVSQGNVLLKFLEEIVELIHTMKMLMEQYPNMPAIGMHQNLELDMGHV